MRKRKIIKAIRSKSLNLISIVKKNKAELLVIKLTVAIISLILIIPLAHFKAKTQSENIVEIASTQIVTYSTDVPDEVPPAPDFEWLGADMDPKKIVIPSIGVDNFIQKVGVDQNNEIAVPNNIHVAGWFVNSVSPGEKGLSIIDGHVDGTETGGVFRNIPNLEVGSEILIILGNDNQLKYRVVNLISVPTAQAVNKLFSQNPKVASQLNLITCGGNWNDNLQEYDQRIIVVTELIE